MKYPLQYINITNSFSNKHKGVDFGWNNSIGKNQPIYSCDEGIVISVEKQSLGGNVIYIKHLNNMVSVYGHLQNNSIRVKVNDKVKKYQHIANMGDSGVVSGPHLHFGLYKPNSNHYQAENALNPLDYLYIYSNQIIDPKSKDIGNIKKYNPFPVYNKGYYKCLANMKIRTLPSVDAKEVKVKDTTKKAKSALISKKNNDNAVFRKNTKFTALEIIYQPDSIWSRTPNGYICIQDLEHKYCVRV